MRLARDVARMYVTKAPTHVAGEGKCRRRAARAPLHAHRGACLRVVSAVARSIWRQRQRQLLSALLD